MIEHFARNQHFQQFDSSYSYLINGASLAQALANIRQIPEYRPSPLLDCAFLAKKLGLAKISCKYEGDRFAGGSFKPLGVANAAIEIVKRILEHRASDKIATAELFSEEPLYSLNDLTFACATSGNHGYALAWIAQRLGTKCRIYCPANTSEIRMERIRALGATVIPVPGSFDDAVSTCSRESETRGDIVVSNLIQVGFEDVPELIMNGYAVLAQEVLDQIHLPITHIFVGGGGGRLAAAIAATFRIHQSENFPKVIVVEPESSDCIASSIEVGEVSNSRASGVTMMTGLVVARPSLVSWPILQSEVFATLSISDEIAIKSLSELDSGLLGDELLPIGETGIAALAGFLSVMRDTKIRDNLDLDEGSHVLVVACEGVTDPYLLDSILEGASGAQK